MKNTRLSDLILRNVLATLTIFLLVVGISIIIGSSIRDNEIDRFEASRHIDMAVTLIKEKVDSINLLNHQLSKLVSKNLRFDGQTGKFAEVDVLSLQKFINELIVANDGIILGVGVQIAQEKLILTLAGSLTGKPEKETVITNVLQSVQGTYYANTFETKKIYIIKSDSEMYLALKAADQPFPAFNEKKQLHSFPLISVSMLLSSQFIESILIREKYSLSDYNYQSYFRVATLSGESISQVGHHFKAFFQVNKRAQLTSLSGPSNEIIYIESSILNPALLQKVAVRLVTLLLTVSLLLAVAWSLFKSIVKRTIEPLRNLEEDIRVLSNSNFNASIEIKGPTEIALVRQSVEKLRVQMLTYANEVTIANVASQVAHDIRSPLAALTMAEKDFATLLPEDTRLMVRSAVGRIRDIANQLLIEKKNKTNSSTTLLETKSEEDMSIHLLSDLIEGILTEKRVQFRPNIGIEIDGCLNTSSYGLFAKIQPSKFKRVLSNIVNNSVEAMGEKCNVTISLDVSKEQLIQIKVQDNGKGIPADILGKLGIRGETHGKEGGSGLGLYHARKSVESWEGKLELQSEIDQGTTVIITIPKADAPSWFVEELRLKPHSNVVVLDDDESIHRIWQGRADSAKFDDFGIKLVHLSTPNELRAWKTESEKHELLTQYLLDFELLGFKETGLDLIEELGIAAQSILVTSRCEELAIRERCLKLKAPLVPKGLAGFVPIRILEKSPLKHKPAAILIDDDDLVHLTWKMSAKQAGLNFLSFKNVDDFFENSQSLDFSTPVYIDSFLGKNKQGQDIRGEKVALQIFNLGFKTIFLATGLAPSNSDQFTWLAGVRDKDPPFTNIGQNG